MKMLSLFILLGVKISRAYGCFKNILQYYISRECPLATINKSNPMGINHVGVKRNGCE